MAEPQGRPHQQPGTTACQALPGRNTGRPPHLGGAAARLWGHGWGWKPWVWLHPRERAHLTQVGCRAWEESTPRWDGEHSRRGAGRGGGQLWAGLYLILLGALRQLPELGVQLRETPCDLLDASVQVPVLAILRVKVVFVALALLRGGNGGVFSEEM